MAFSSSSLRFIGASLSRLSSPLLSSRTIDLSRSVSPSGFFPFRSFYSFPSSSSSSSSPNDGHAEASFNRSHVLNYLGSRPSAPPSPRYRPIELKSVSPLRSVPDHIIRPDYANPSVKFFDPRNSQSETQNGIEIKDKKQIERMRKVCHYTALTRSYAGSLVRPGITTEEIDEKVHNFIVQLGCYPSPLLYAKFPKSLCSSINEVVVHGIPDSRVLEEGDLINLDVSLYFDGMHGDCNGTFIAGGKEAIDAAGLHLIETTRFALDAAIAICGPGVPFNKIGSVIHDIADIFGYGVVRNFCGHGIGRSLHMPPLVYHFRNEVDLSLMHSGMTFTIEPMLCEGTSDLYSLSDGWTIVTADGKRSAQFEETLLITENGAEILTKC